MAQIRSPERLDILLALALVSASKETAPALLENSTTSQDELDERSLSAALDTLSELGSNDRRALETRAAAHARLTREQRQYWLAQVLRYIRTYERDALLDEQIHPSHIAEALRDEPLSICTIILQHLPRPLAEQAAIMLNVTFPAQPSRDSRPHAQAAPLILNIIRRNFLARFVSIIQLWNPSSLDLLSGVELRRLVKLLGAREIANACRALPIEEAKLFLRRFTAEDARMIAAHTETHMEIDAQRAVFAQRLLDAAMKAETAPEAVLNHIGIKLLAMALVEGGTVRLRYTAQKIPFGASRGLSELVAASREGDDPSIIRLITEEAEALARGLRQPQMKNSATGSGGVRKAGAQGHSTEMKR